MDVIFGVEQAPIICTGMPPNSRQMSGVIAVVSVGKMTPPIAVSATVTHAVCVGASALIVTVEVASESLMIFAATVGMLPVSKVTKNVALPNQQPSIPVSVKPEPV